MFASDELDRIVAAAQAERRLPSVSAAVFHRGEIVWSRAIGLADVGRGGAATSDHAYRIGSITKTFTAAAIMQLRDAGKLDLEDTLDRHVEGAAHTPSIRRLLSHASGLQRETQDDSWLTLRFAPPDELLETLAQAELVLPSGARFHYSNLAFALLGIVVERASGVPYQDYVRECEWREDLLMLSQSASALDGVSFGQRFQESLVQLAFADIFRALKDPETRTDRLNHIRILNSLARLNREALNVRRYNDLRDDKAAGELQATAKIPSVEEAQHGIFCAFDHAMSLKPAPGPIGPDLNIYLGLDPRPAPAAPKQSEGGPAAPTGRAEASDQRRKSDEGGPALRSASPTAEVLPVLRSASGEGGLTKAVDEGGPASASIPQPDRSSRPEEVLTPETSLSPGTEPATCPPLTDSLTRPLADSTPVTTVPHSNIEIQNPKMKTFPEKCHECRVELPPLLPSGERPQIHCRNCGTPLRDLAERHLYCPACQGSLHKIFIGAHRTSNDCPHCAITLPPPPAAPALRSAFDEGGPALPDTLSNTLSPPGTTTPSTLAA
jgi:hypothetical protein